MTGLSPATALAVSLPAGATNITIPPLPAVAVTLKASAPTSQHPETGTTLRDPTLQLVVGNPTSTFVSAALQVTFELWSISAPPTRVFTTTVPTGPSTTSVTVPPATLQDGEAYAWRAFASLDDATGPTATGPTSTPFAFDTMFIVIDPPTLLYPIGGETSTELHPQLFIDNGAVQGDAGLVDYVFQLDTNSAFPNPVQVTERRLGTTGERTIATLPNELPPVTTYYWRVRGTNGTATGDWSQTESFTTPERINAQGDQINPNTINWLHTNVTNWAVTSRITGVRITSHQICVFHTAAGQWPQSTSVFEDGAPIEGNIWIFGFVNGQWHGATWDWLRPGQECKSATAEELGSEQIRIPPLDGSWVPRSGDTVGVMMSTIARFGSVDGNTQRTNIARVTWP